MRLIITIIASVSIVTGVLAQGLYPKETKRADKAYDQFSYLKAAKLYTSYLPSDDSVYILQRLSSTYLFLNQDDSARVYLKRTVELPNIDPEFYFHYAESLTSSGEYEEANEWYRKYKVLVPDDSRVADKISATQNINSFFQDSSSFSLTRASFNSRGLDFSPTFYKEGVVFASSRPNRKETGRGKFNWDKSPFLDLYFAKSNTQAQYFSGSLNSNYHEGPLEFYNGELNVVMTRNNYHKGKLGRDKQGIARLKIFFSEYSEKEEDWKEPSPFQYNSDAYSNGHPTITEDGQVLIYASDMPGGYGQSDIYVCFKEEQGWSKPKNLGSVINSEGRESFPFLSGKKLFFASDGDGGLGGLDVFELDLNDDFSVKTTPNNLGFPINTKSDDFGLITNGDFSEGYFTSARNELERDDIYYFVRTETALIGEVYDFDLQTPINKADVFINDSLSNKIAYARSDVNGQFPLPASGVLAITAGKFSYDLYQQVLVDLDTLNDGRIRIYLRRSAPIVEAIVDDLISVEDSLLIDPIYYDFDKHDLRNLSENQLDRVLYFLNKYPSVRLELSSHTDSRGSDKYNIALSERRAKEASQYLFDNKIDPSRIEPKGYGETQLTNRCDDNTRCNNQNHQLNRRTEFKILED